MRKTKLSFDLFAQQHGNDDLFARFYRHFQPRSLSRGHNFEVSKYDGKNEVYPDLIQGQKIKAKAGPPSSCKSRSGVHRQDCRRQPPTIIALSRQDSYAHTVKGATQGTLRYDLTGVSTRAGNRQCRESSKTPSQAALAPYGSDRVNRDPPKRDLWPAARGCSVGLLFRRVYFVRTPCLEVHSTPAPRVRACASLPLTSPETTL
jgi:hypothetical protein